ncbi:hypothetical protein B0H14DRAFT_3427348 [Mycena olivaceomarginata]|nr:hypothetical protein B0H14DRAFT_3427348 [Mycena olivaceomarginata]
MPRPTQKDANAEIQQLKAQLAQKNSEIVKLKSDAKKQKKKQRLIPPPDGQAGRSEAGGGYNLQRAMGLEGDDTRYHRLHLTCNQRMVKRYIHQYLSVFHTISEQETGVVKRFILISEEEEEADDETANVKQRTKTASRSKAPKATPKKILTKKRVSNTVLSDASDSGDDDLKTLMEALTKSPKKAKAKKATSVKHQELDSDDSFPIGIFGSKGKDTALKTDKKNKENDRPATSNLKRKADSSLPASPPPKKAGLMSIRVPSLLKQKSKPAPAAATTDTDTEDTLAPLLTWNDLPSHCPSTLCSDPLPKGPINAILSLCNRRKALTDANGPQAKGRYLIELEICKKITLEKCRPDLTRLGKQCRWPQSIDWHYIQYRICGMESSILDMFKNPTTLDSCAIWHDFLVSIDYNLLDFSVSKSKSTFKKALLGKRCGYYGPQGESVIYSCLMRLISELDEDEDELEQNLVATLHKIVTEGTNNEQFDYEELASSNYLSLDDFIRFILKRPAERAKSNEYSDLFFFENDDDEAVEKIHKQNTLALRSARNQKAAEKLAGPSAPPPRLRKHREVAVTPENLLKIKLPPPAVVAEKEITLDDFPPVCQA